MSVQIKPLAQWKTWWSHDDVERIAECLVQHMDPTKLPERKLVNLAACNKVSIDDVEDAHTAKVVEGLVESYPPEKEPSAYLLGDVVLRVNLKLHGIILGHQKINPVDEKARRTEALKQGGLLKLLLSYIRGSTGRCEKGRSPTVTYLKELTRSKGRPSRKNLGSSSPAPSVCSTASTSTAVTLLLDGRPITALSGSTPSPRSTAGGNLAKTIHIFQFQRFCSCCNTPPNKPRI